jgi:holo-[acyl-carrier protein] synthase
MVDEKSAEHTHRDGAPSSDQEDPSPGVVATSSHGDYVGANVGTVPGDVAGLGVDIVEIGRMQTICARTPRFKERLFSEQERAYCDARPRPEIHYALFFAAKEAVLKALGTGFTGMKVTDVEVDHDRFGRPIVLLHGHASEVAEEQGILNIYLSLSYTQTVGVASAVAAKEEHKPHKMEKIDPKAELTAQFRELRAMLNDIDDKLTQIEQEKVTELSLCESSGDVVDMFDEIGEREAMTYGEDE